MKNKLLVQRYKDKDRKPREESIFDLLYTEDGKTVCLQYSPLGNWTMPGKNAAKLTSDGNGFKIWLSGGPYKEPLNLYLDYCSANYLFQLLKINYKLYDKLRPTLVMEDKIVNKLSDLNKPPKKKKLLMEDIRAAIANMDEEEVMLVMDAAQERLVDRGWQWGDILGNVWTWLNVHAGGARETYTKGGHPIFFYGDPDILPKK